jgi:hypothetical protein
MDGLILRSKISIENVMVDERVKRFAQSEQEEAELEEKLELGKREAAVIKLCRIFSFTEIVMTIEKSLPELMKKKTGPKEKNIQLQEQLSTMFGEAQKHAEGFHRQIKAMVAKREDGSLDERKSAATKYFTMKVLEPAMAMVDEHITSLGTLTKVAKQVRLWKEIKNLLKMKWEELGKVVTREA